MVSEKPPRGYDKMDKPLPHEFYYEVNFDATVAGNTGFIATYIRTTKNSVDPATIEVNPRNTNFAKDEGPVICYDSIVAKINLHYMWSLPKHFLETDKITALSFQRYPIQGVWEDAWTPADEKSTLTIAQLVNVLSDTTNEDVIPEFNGTNLQGVGNHPLSTITAAEAFGDYSLTTDAVMEGVSMFNPQPLRDAFQYYTNGGKLKTIIGKITNHDLSRQKPNARFNVTKFIRPQFRNGNPHLFVGEAVQVPQPTSQQQYFSSGEDSTGDHLRWAVHVRYNEWNKLFNQSRM